MLSTARTENEDGYKSLLAGDFNGLKRNAKRKRTNATDPFGVCPSPPLSHIGKSQTVVTSDSLDVRGPIPLTRAGLHVRSVLSLTFVLCNFSPVGAWHTPCARSKFSSCSEFRERQHSRQFGG